MNVVLSIVSLVAFVLIVGGVYLVRQGTNAKQGWLMLVLAAVMLTNVAIWTLPTEDGATLADSADPD